VIKIFGVDDPLCPDHLVLARPATNKSQFYSPSGVASAFLPLAAGRTDCVYGDLAAHDRGDGTGAVKEAETATEQTLCLPIYGKLAKQDVVRIADVTMETARALS
jgi:hypothetical protein